MRVLIYATILIVLFATQARSTVPISSSCQSALAESAHKELLIKLANPTLLNRVRNSSLTKQQLILFELINTALPLNQKSARRMIELFISSEAWMHLTDNEVRLFAQKSQTFISIIDRMPKQGQTFGGTFATINSRVSEKVSLWTKFTSLFKDPIRSKRELEFKNLERNLKYLFKKGLAQTFEQKIILNALKDLYALYHIQFKVPEVQEIQRVPDSVFQLARFQNTITAHSLLSVLRVEDLREVLRNFLDETEVHSVTDNELVKQLILSRKHPGQLSEIEASTICEASTLCQYWLKLAQSFSAGFGIVEEAVISSEKVTPEILLVHQTVSPKATQVRSEHISSALERMYEQNVISQDEYYLLKQWSKREGMLMDKMEQIVPFLNANNGVATVQNWTEFLKKIGYQVLEPEQVGMHSIDNNAKILSVATTTQRRIYRINTELLPESVFDNRIFEETKNLLIAKHLDGDVFIFEFSEGSLNSVYRLIPFDYDQVIFEKYQLIKEHSSQSMYNLCIFHIDGRSCNLDRQF